MKKIKVDLFVALFSLGVLGLNVPVNAAEIIYQEDIMQNVVTRDVLVRTADNVIILVDASSSMAFSHRKFKKTNYELEKEALAAGYSRLPDLGYNVGIYNFAAPGKIANFTVLEQDPYKVDPKKLKDITIGGTVFEGRLFPIPDSAKRGVGSRGVAASAYANAFAGRTVESIEGHDHDHDGHEACALASLSQAAVVAYSENVRR
jgi:hypothetical protein